MNELVVQIVSPDQFKGLYEKYKNSDQKYLGLYPVKHDVKVFGMICLKDDMCKILSNMNKD